MGTAQGWQHGVIVGVAAWRQGWGGGVRTECGWQHGDNAGVAARSHRGGDGAGTARGVGRACRQSQVCGITPLSVDHAPER